MGLLRLYVGAPRMAPYLMVRTRSRLNFLVLYPAKGLAVLASAA